MDANDQPLQLCTGPKARPEPLGRTVNLATLLDTRREVLHQVGRISNLASDLLDCAKPWKLSISPIDLADRVRAPVR